MQLTRAFGPRDVEEQVCWMCEVEFEPTSVLIHGGPMGDSMCETCFSYCSLRQKLSEIGVSWPTWEQYQEFRKQYPKPIYETEEEVDRAEEADGYDSIERAAFLTNTGSSGSSGGQRDRIIELRDRIGTLEAELFSLLGAAEARTPEGDQ